MSCADSGSFTAVQEGNTITFTVKEYEAGADTAYPKTSVNGTTYYTDPAKILEAVFSAFQFKVVWPCQNAEGETLQSKYGNGTLSIKAVDAMVEAFSTAGNQTTTQTKSDDDTAEGTRSLTSGKGHSHEIFYSDRKVPSQGTLFGGSGNTAADDSDVAASGQEIAYTVNYRQVDAGPSNSLEGKAVAVDQLVLFEGAVDVTDPFSPHGLYGGGSFQCTALYAAKNDGTPLQGDEIYTLTEDDLMYAEEKPKNCVGILYQWRGCYNHDGIIWAHGYAKIKPDDQYADGTCMITVCTREWTVEDFHAEMTKYAEKQGKTLSDMKDVDYMAWAQSQNPSEMVQGKTDYDTIDNREKYKKPVYDEEGYHVGGNFSRDRADAIYVVPYYTQVTKTVAQTDENNKPLQTFNISNEYRYVDYKITSAMSFVQGVEPVEDSSTTVTLTDVIPKGLTYVPGSARWGNCEYLPQDRGKSPGVITGGTQMEPALVENEDGSVTLIWKIENVELVNGDLPSLYYSCKIGDERYPSQDVQSGTSLENKVTIKTEGDKRSFTPANKNISDTAVSVINMSSYNIDKTSKTDLEMEDQGWFHLLISNAEEQNKINVFMFDSMPANGKNHTVMEGSYRITSVRIDPDPNAIGENGLADVEIYYTDDPQYAGLTSMPSDLTADKAKAWKKAVLDTGSGSITGDGLIGGWPAAIVYADASLGRKCAAYISIEYEAWGADGDNLNNEFIGRTSTAVISAAASAVTYYRDLEGTVWLDEDRDGLIGKDERRFSGAAVRLQILTEDKNGDPVYRDCTAYKDKDGKTVPPTTVTDQDGHYKFTGLPAGTYRVVFSSNEDKNIFDISGYSLTESDKGGDEEIANNSKITCSVTDDETHKLQEAVIEEITLPTLEEMKAEGEREYHEPYQNCGLWAEHVPDQPLVNPPADSQTDPPSGPSSGSSSDSSSQSQSAGPEGSVIRAGARTGDDTGLGFYLAMLAMSCGAAGVLVWKKMRKD